MIKGLIYYCDKQRHLVCMPYSVENLHRMAADLGIHRGWFDPEPKYPHYDIPVRRLKEIMAQCVVVRPREILAITKGR